MLEKLPDFNVEDVCDLLDRLDANTRSLSSFDILKMSVTDSCFFGSELLR